VVLGFDLYNKLKKAMMNKNLFLKANSKMKKNFVESKEKR
jgi:hypothetical protein